MQKINVMQALNLSVDAISKEYAQKAIETIKPQVWELVKDNYLSAHYQPIMMMISSIYVNDCISWFTLKWTCEYNKSKDVDDAIMYDNGRRLGIVQGLSVAISQYTNVVDLFNNPNQSSYGNNHLSTLMNYVYNQWHKMYCLFADMLDKQMNKYGYKSKDLIKIFNKNCKNK